jgi:hypothetical protein
VGLGLFGSIGSGRKRSHANRPQGKKRRTAIKTSQEDFPRNFASAIAQADNQKMYTTRAAKKRRRKNKLATEEIVLSESKALQEFSSRPRRAMVYHASQLLINAVTVQVKFHISGNPTHQALTLDLLACDINCVSELDEITEGVPDAPS